MLEPLSNHGGESDPFRSRQEQFQNLAQLKEAIFRRASEYESSLISSQKSSPKKVKITEGLLYDIISRLRDRETLGILEASLQFARDRNHSQLFSIIGFSELRKADTPVILIRPEHAYLYGTAHSKVRVAFQEPMSELVTRTLSQAASDLIDSEVPIHCFQFFVTRGAEFILGPATLERDYELNDLARALEDLSTRSTPTKVQREILTLLLKSPALGEDPLGIESLHDLTDSWEIVSKHSSEKAEKLWREVLKVRSHIEQAGDLLDVKTHLIAAILSQSPDEKTITALLDSIDTAILSGNHHRVGEVVRAFSLFSSLPELPQLQEKFTASLREELLRGASPEPGRRLVQQSAALLTARTAGKKESPVYARQLLKSLGENGDALLWEAAKGNAIESYKAEQLAFDPTLARHYEQAGPYDLFRRLLRDSPKLNQNFEETSEQSFVAPVQQRFDLWKRVLDVYFGYGALLYEAKRPPSREPALLTRFGSELGEVRYVNASNPNSFPGKGVAIGGLNLSRIFAPVPDRPKDPYGLYREAWPGLADEFEDLPKAEFIFARGMILISCADEEKYGVDHNHTSGTKRVQYSLAIFNSHFGDPDSLVAVLLPTRTAARLFARSLEPFEDFRGFNTERPDLSVVTPSPMTLLEAAGSSAIQIGNPLLLSSSAGQEGFLTDWSKYYNAVEDHNRAIKAWDNLFRNSYLQGEERQFLGEYLGIPVTASYKVEMRLHDRAASLELQKEDLEDDYQDQDQKLEIASRLLNLFDLFRISQAYWHRGHTLPSQNAEEIDFELIDQESIALAGDESDGADQDQDLYINPFSLRALRAAFEFHSARSEGVDDPASFPILCSCNALSYMGAPDGELMLDTFSMQLSYRGKSIQLGPDELSMEDEIFWATEVMPKLTDQAGLIRDLRFYDRKSFSHDFTKGEP